MAKLNLCCFYTATVTENDVTKCLYTTVSLHYYHIAEYFHERKNFAKPIYMHVPLYCRNIKFLRNLFSPIW